MNTRNTYHTTLKDLIRLGLCPPQLLKEIPRANIYRWRNEPASKYFGRDDETLEKFHIYAKELAKHPGYLFACGRLLNTLLSIIRKSNQFKSWFSLHKKQIVKVIFSVSKTIHPRKAIKFFDISRNTYFNWQNVCDASPINYCRRRYSNQLMPEEVNRLERLLTDHKMKHWGINSIHFWAKRKGLLEVSLNTWYKYNNLFRWKSKAEKVKKRVYSPLRSSQPDVYWHADVSIHHCADGTRGYIYAVVDNASRKVISWEVSTSLSGSTMKLVLNRAYQLKTQETKTKLIVDGGAENFNVEVTDFLSKTDITRMRATVDIKQSNSMVEALFKSLKHTYLLRKSPESFQELKKYVNFYFNDANQNKPLQVLGGLTPDEYYYHRPIKKFQNVPSTQKARGLRIAYNKANRCPICP